jgi:hypothetical protein
MQHELRTESLESLQREGSTYQHVEYDNTPHETTTIILDKFITTPFPLPYNNTFQFKEPKSHKWEQWKRIFMETNETKNSHQHEAFHVLSKLFPKIISSSWLLPNMGISNIVIVKPELKEENINLNHQETPVSKLFAHLQLASNYSTPSSPNKTTQEKHSQLFLNELLQIENELRSVSDEFYETVKQNSHVIRFGYLDDVTFNSQNIYLLLPGKHSVISTQLFIGVIGLGAKPNDVQLEIDIGYLQCCHITNVNIKSSATSTDLNQPKCDYLELQNCSSNTPVRTGNAVIRNCVFTDCEGPAVQVIFNQKLVLLDQCVIENCCMIQDGSSAIEIQITDSPNHISFNMKTKVTKLILHNVKFVNNRNADIGYSIPPAECNDIFTINLSKETMEPLSTYRSFINSFRYKCYGQLKLTHQTLNTFIQQGDRLKNDTLIRIVKPTIDKEPLPKTILADDHYPFHHQVDPDTFAYLKDTTNNYWVIMFSKPVRWLHADNCTGSTCQICKSDLFEYRSNRDVNAQKLIEYVNIAVQSSCILHVCSMGHVLITEYVFSYPSSVPESSDALQSTEDVTQTQHEELGNINSWIDHFADNPFLPQMPIVFSSQEPMQASSNDSADSYSVSKKKQRKNGTPY